MADNYRKMEIESPRLLEELSELIVLPIEQIQEKLRRNNAPSGTVDLVRRHLLVALAITTASVCFESGDAETNCKAFMEAFADFSRCSFNHVSVNTYVGMRTKGERHDDTRTTP